MLQLNLIMENVTVWELHTLRTSIRPSLISPRTKLIGVPTIRLPAVIMLKIFLNQLQARL